MRTWKNFMHLNRLTKTLMSGRRVWESGRCSREYRRRSCTVLDASGLPYRVLIEDLRPMLAAQRSGAVGFYDDFRTNDEINNHMAGLVAQYPQLASTVVFGQSIEGRTITGIRVTGLGTNKPGVLFHGCQHRANG